jgi:hypothetical protein
LIADTMNVFYEAIIYNEVLHFPLTEDNGDDNVKLISQRALTINTLDIFIICVLTEPLSWD